MTYRKLRPAPYPTASHIPVPHRRQPREGDRKTGESKVLSDYEVLLFTADETSFLNEQLAIRRAVLDLQSLRAIYVSDRPAGLKGFLEPADFRIGQRIAAADEEDGKVCVSDRLRDGYLGDQASDSRGTKVAWLDDVSQADYRKQQHAQRCVRRLHGSLAKALGGLLQKGRAGD